VQISGHLALREINDLNDLTRHKGRQGPQLFGVSPKGVLTPRDLL
jgi:hypothetical protein